jgi:hypothetical protein
MNELKLLKKMEEEIKKNFRDYIVCRYDNEYDDDAQLISSKEVARENLIDIIYNNNSAAIFLESYTDIDDFLDDIDEEDIENINAIIIRLINNIKNFVDYTYNDTQVVYESVNDINK